MAASHMGSQRAARAEAGIGEGTGGVDGAGPEVDAGAEVDAAKVYTSEAYRMLGRKTPARPRVMGPGADGVVEAAAGDGPEGCATPEAVLEGNAGVDVAPEARLEGGAGGGKEAADGNVARAGGTHRHGVSTSGEGEEATALPCENGKHNSSK